MNFTRALATLAKAPELETVMLRFGGRDAAGLPKVLPEILEARPAKLKEIEFYSSSNTSYAGFPKQLAHMVTALPNLERLTCYECDMGDAGFEEFSTVIVEGAANLKLKSLTFYHCKMGEAGARALGEVLALAPGLESFDVYGNKNVTDAGGVGLLTPLLTSSSSTSSLKSIDISYTAVANGTAGILAELIKKEPLEEIRVNDTKIPNASVIALAKACHDSHHKCKIDSEHLD
mmetsp:Transcript_15064/g.28306  ORF Transcript_15064/g.28306 Transcript_15064/m.28306 type:complete len:233 (-) Transcript_15064:177-875(-)